MSEFKIQKAEGRYKLEDMQKRASVASTADGLTLEGPNFKLGCLTACPDMLLFACEELAKANERVKELEKAKHKDSLETISDYILEFMQVNEIKNFSTNRLSTNEGRQIELTLRYVDGETPADQLCKARERIEELEEQLRKEQE